MAYRRGERSILKAARQEHPFLAATFLAAGMSFGAIAAPAHAQDRIYVGPGTDWTSATNWSGNDVADTQNETAVFQNNGAPAQISLSGVSLLDGMRFDANAPVRTINISSIINLLGSGINNQSGVIQRINVDGASPASLQMTGTSDFTGTQTDIYVSNGFLQFAIESNGSRANAIMAGGSTSLQATDGTITLGALGGTGTVFATTQDGGAANQILTVGGLNLSTSFSGLITETGGSRLNIVKVGTGTLTLASTNDYSGTTTISAGTLQIGNGGATGTMGSGDIVNNSVLQINRTGTIAIDGDISGTGTLELQLGTLTLNGANSYSGVTTVRSGGILDVRNSSALGTTAGNTVVQSGGALELGGGINVDDDLVLAGLGVTNLGALRNISGLNTVNGDITLGSTTRINAEGSANFVDTLNVNGAVLGGGNALIIGGSGRVQFQSEISDITSLTYDGTGVLFMGGANSFLGSVTISSGSLQTLGGASIADSASLTVNGSYQMGASETIGSLQGTGLVILSATGGATTLTTGGNNMSSTFSGQIIEENSVAGSVGSLVKNGSGVFALTGANSYSGSTQINAGTLQIGNGGATGSLAGGDIGIGGGASLIFNRSNDFTATNQITGAGRLVKAGGGRLTLSGASSYTGVTTVQAGTLSVSNSDALGSAAGGTVVESGGALELQNDVVVVGEALTLNGTGVASGGALKNASGYNFWNGPISLASASRIVVNGSATPAVDELVLEGTLAGGGHSLSVGGSGRLSLNSAVSNLSSLTMDGIGTLALTNTGFDGNLFANNGIVQFAGGSAIADTAAVTVGAPGVLQLGASETIGSLAGSGRIDMFFGSGLTVGGNNSSTLFSGVIADSSPNASLTKTGTGTLTLTGTNSYTGATTVSGGTLQIGNGGMDGTLGAAAINLLGGELALNRAGTLALANRITGNGTLRQLGTGTTVLTGSNVAGQNFTGTVFVDSGRLAIDGDFGDVTGNSAQLVVGAAGTLGGGGTFFGDVDARNGTLAPGNSPGTLNIAGNLLLGAGTTLNFELGEAGTVGGANNDLVNVGGDLTLDGTLNTIAVAPAYGPGYYRLFNYGGTLTDNGLNIGSIAGGYTPTVLTNINGQVNLLLGDGAGQIVQYWDGADTTGASVVANGDGGSGVWNAAGTNWTTQTGFGVNDAWQGQVAVFGGASGGNVTVEGTQVFQELRFDTAGYTLQAGAGGALATTGGFSVIDVDAPLATVNVGISGNGGLTKTGAGTLVLGAANGYAGVTTVSEGVLRIAASGSIGGAGVVNSAGLENAGTINSGITNSGTLTSTGIINGALSNSGTASLAGQLNGALSNTGSVVLTGATSGITALTQDAAGDLDLGGFDTSIGAISGAGTIELGGATLTTGGANGNTSFAGMISGAGGLTKTGSGALTLNGVSDYAGATTVAQGTLQISTTGAIGGSGVANNATLQNAGTIATSVVNTGSLVSTGRIDGALTNSATASLAGQLNGNIGNNGSITLTGTTTGVAALTQTAGATFDLAGFSTTIASLSGAGTVQTGSSAATVLTVGDTTSTQFAGVIAGSGGLVKTGTGTLTLTGANSHSGGTLISGGTLQLGNGGTSGAIGGAVVNDGTLVINRSDNIVFGNALSGSGRFVQAGGGTTTLSANSLTGGFEISGGRLRGDATTFGTNAIRADATVEFAQAAAGTFAGAISGGGLFEKTGAGRLVLTGTSGFTGQTRLLGGELAVNGSLAQSALALAAGTRLSGTGTVGSVTVAGGATIAPGNSIGTLNVNGDISFAPGSIYEVEVDPAGATADLIAASGRAVLNGGSVVHIGLDGNYRPLTTYTILTAAGGVQGVFSNITSSFAFLDPTLGYSANAVTLTLARNDIDFSDVAVTLNQGEVANGVEELSFGNPLFDTVLLLDENGARLAFDQLSGEIYPSLLAGFVQDSRFVRGAALDRMRHFGAAADAEPGVRLWMQGLGSRGHLDGDGNARRMKQDSAGFLMGIDAIASETVQLGAFGGYQQGDASVRAASSEADIDSYHVGVYAGAELGVLALRAGYSFSWHKADVTRRIAFGDFSDVTTGKFDASTAQAFAEIGYRIDFGSAQIEPFAQIAQIWVDSERMNEQGGAAALQVARAKMSTGVSTLGARLDQGFSLGSLGAHLKLSAGWRHAFDDRVAVTASAFDTSPSFRIAGAPIARDAFAADVGISLALSNRTRLDLSYSGDVASRAESHAGRATFSWAF